MLVVTDPDNRSAYPLLKYCFKMRQLHIRS